METATQKLGKVSITVEKDPHSLEKEYNRLVIVNDIISGKTYISRKPVPINTQLTNKEYWIPTGALDEQVILNYNAFKQAIETDILNMEIDINDYKEAISAAEALRIAAEANRVNAELTRVNAEAIRSNEERTRSQAEITRQSNEEIRQQQEGTSSDSPNASGSRWARYKKAENDRQTSFTNNESERNTVFESSQQNKTEAFNSSESSRAQTFNESQNSRTTAFNEAQTNRTQAYNQAESNRDTQYASAEGSSAGSELGDSSRWGKYKEAEENRNVIVNSIKENICYYVCDTAESTVNKTISSSNYTLITGGTIKIKFTHKNTATSPTLQIGSAAAKPLYYNGVVASSSNSWLDNEIVDIYYDGEYYQARNHNSSFKEGEAIHDVSIVNDITTGGEHNVLSAEQGKVLKEKIPIIKDTDEDITGNIVFGAVSAKSETDGEINNSSSTYKMTEYIAVNEGDKLSITTFTTSMVYCIAAFDSLKQFIADSTINTKGSSQLKTINITIPNGVSYIIVTNNFIQNPDGQVVIRKLQGLFNNLECLQEFEENNNDLYWKSKKVIVDLTISIVSKNLADLKEVQSNDNKGNGVIKNYLIGNTGLIQANTDWDCYRFSVSEGDILSIAGFNLGRTGFYAFYNGTTKVSYASFVNPSGTTTPLVLTVPSGVNILYFDIRSGSSVTPQGDTTPYDKLQINVGDTLQPYDVFKEEITKINGFDIFVKSEIPDDLEQRVSDIETDIVDLQEEISETNEDLIADLPQSDGTDVETGYAYIDSATGVVKVKLS